MEPIHRPRAIHGIGYMLIMDEANPYYALAMSENFPVLMGKEKTYLFQKPVWEWLPKEMTEMYTEMLDSMDWDSVDPTSIQIDTHSLNIIRHKHLGKNIFEIEPADSSEDNGLSSFRAIRVVNEPLGRITDLENLYQVFCKSFKKISGYDRVMLYKFDKDHHGHVVGEAKEPELEAFLGLHYPATDIPKMARDLFLLNKTRIIPDIHQANNWLMYNPGLGDQRPHLDLSYSQHRATSPIHIQYLKNMGVGASMTLAIIINNELWGLVACHHYGPKFSNYEFRKTTELIANNLALRISEIISQKYFREKSEANETLRVLFSKINNLSDVGIQLSMVEYDFRQLMDADGFLLWVEQIGIYKQGLTPSDDFIPGVKKVLEAKGPYEVLYSEDLTVDYPELNTPNKIGGMISVRLEGDNKTWLFWFRRSQKSEFHWGGDPNQPYEVDYLKDGQVKLSPRKSFERWKKMVDTSSRPWSKVDLETAEEVRDGLLRKLVERQASKVSILKREFEQLTYAASHDLQEPLRTVTNYLEIIGEELNGGDTAMLKMYMDRTELAADRMKSLIRDLLEYSRIGNDPREEWVDLNEVLGDVSQDLELLIQENKANIHFDKLPVVRSVATEMRQLFYNFLTNSLKYRKEHVAPVISIRSNRAAETWVFHIQDNGIGIEEVYFDQIFLLFNRLHSKEMYSGTGIGLASCKKIIDGMHGTLWVSSDGSSGSTFHFSLPISLIKGM